MALIATFVALLLILGAVLYVLDNKPPAAIWVLFLGALLMLSGLGAGLVVSVVAPATPGAAFLTNACLAIASVGGNLMAASALFKTQINQVFSANAPAIQGNAQAAPQAVAQGAAPTQLQSPPQLANQPTQNPATLQAQAVGSSPPAPDPNSKP